MKKISLLIFSLFLAISLFAQREETLFGPYGLQLTGVWGGPSASITQFDNDYAVYTGGSLGLEFGRIVFVGWGRHQLVNDVDFDAFTAQNFEMKYNGLILGAMALAHKPVHPTFKVLTGRGKIEIDDLSRSDKIFVIQPALGIELNIFRWFHLELTGGYRIVTDTDIPELTDEDLSAPFGELTFKFGYSWGRHRH